MELKFRPQDFESIEELRKYNQGMGGSVLQSMVPIPYRRCAPMLQHIEPVWFWGVYSTRIRVPFLLQLSY